MKSSREHEDEGYLSVRESGESARLPAPQAAVILLSTIVAEEAPTDTLNPEPARLQRRFEPWLDSPDSRPDSGRTVA